MANHEATPFVCWGYGRASTDAQCLSTSKQESICLDIFEFKKRTNPEWANAIWGGWVADEATCRETKFRQRHFGSLVLAGIKPRDRIICAVHDRLFGDLIDFCETIKLCETMKFVICVGDKEIDFEDEAAVCYYKIVTAFAELEVKRLRRRIREAFAHRKKIGRPSGGHAPIGWKNVVVTAPGGSGKYLVPDNAARRLAREISKIRTNMGVGYNKATSYCNKVLHVRNRHGKKWTFQTFYEWCRAAENGFPLPNGSHEAAPIPADATQINGRDVSEDG